MLDHLRHIDVHPKDLIHEHLDDRPLVLLVVALDLLDLLADLVLLRDHLLVQSASLGLLLRELLRGILIPTVKFLTRVLPRSLNLFIPSSQRLDLGEINTFSGWPLG